MNGKTLKCGLKEWKEAYEQKVQEVTGFKYYHTKANANKVFEKLANSYPEVQPFTFMEAVFPPNQKWFMPKRGNPKFGWNKLQYPFPNMLLGEKARTALKRYFRQGKAKRDSFQEEVLQDVQESLAYLGNSEVKLQNYEELFWQAHANYISPYLFACLPNAIAWIMCQSSKGDIPQEAINDILAKNEELQRKLELKFKIRELIGAHERN